jgi:pimeloyl-ACP methyl ester carboxylesterase
VTGRTPLELLGRLAVSETELAPGLRLVESYTMEGMLKLLWFGDPAAEEVVLLLGGGMGGFLGPADGLYTELGRRLAADGTGVVAVDYRRPSKLEPSLLDAAATADWAMTRGGRRFLVVGHSFGGAVAVQCGIALGGHCVGVVTLATQSAGCENAQLLGGTPLLLLHGTADEVLGPENSGMVQTLAGGGDLRVLQGVGHQLDQAAAEVRDLLLEWIPARFADRRPG